jgi:prolyl 4-hydroxylase
MKYFIDKNFLTNKECDNLLEYYNENISLSYHYKMNNTYPLKLFNNSKFDSLIDEIESFYKPGFDASHLDNLEIVRWPVGSYMEEHYDGHDKMGFFIYLNDDFEGGETELVNLIKVKPEKGTLLIFNNGEILHKVNKILLKDRYTLAGWYT